MLFQPTNITPSTRGGLGNGTVDATKDLTVTFQVNGNSPLVAFAITIYTNNASSTQLYTTGKITDNCPFYGINYAGDIQFFSYTIPAATLSSASIANGGNYKLIITQWWNENDYVTQTSASAFITRATPTLTMDSISSPVTTRVYTFSATYSQTEGDSLNWVRWMLAYDGQTDDPIYDSQNIYGTAEISMYYDGLFKDTSYVVRCIIQTENGVEADTGWVSFSVSYASASMEGVVTANRVCNKSAILLSWPMVQYIPPTISGTYSVGGDGSLVLRTGNILWDSVNNDSMSFGQPWTLFYKTKITQDSSTILSISRDNGKSLTASYNKNAQTFTIANGGTAFTTLHDIPPSSIITIVLTETTLYIRVKIELGGLYPATNLYPSTTLYPRENEQSEINTYEVSVNYTQGAITSVRLYGYQQCYYLQIEEGTAEQSVIDNAYLNDVFTPSHDPGVYFSLIFSQSLNGGTLGIDSSDVNALAVYRREGQSGSLQHLGDYPLSVSSMLDYGAKNQQGPYKYYMFPMGETIYTDPLESNDISLCDWDWSLLACADRGGGDDWYTVEAEYRFGKNLSSGSMSNNNSPNILENFTIYPTVQLSPSNYKSGTLQSLIGKIDYKNGNAYSDSIGLRDEIFALSTSRQTLFLKNRKGDLFRIRLSGAVTMETMDGTKEQAQSVSLPWAEIGNAENASLTVTPQDSFWEGADAG